MNGERLVQKFRMFRLACARTLYASSAQSCGPQALGHQRNAELSRMFGSLIGSMSTLLRPDALQSACAVIGNLHTILHSTLLYSTLLYSTLLSYKL